MIAKKAIKEQSSIFNQSWSRGRRGLGVELVCYRTNHIQTINSKQSQGIDPIKEKQNDSVPIPSW